MSHLYLLLAALSSTFAGPEGPGPVRARIDAHGNLVIGRRPHFPIELYGVRTEEDFAIASAHGFNAVIEFGEGIETRAARYGMLLTDPNWFHHGVPDSKVREEARRHRGKPAIFAYNLNDEPDLRPESGAGPDDLARFARALRRWDPSRLLSVTCAGGAGGTKLWKDYAALVDVFRIDPYPLISGAPLSVVTRNTVLAREATGPRKPVWVVLQAWTLGPGSGFPTARQDRCMTYLALASGAKGISHFDFNPDVWSQHPGFWNGLLLTNRELRLLSPAILSGIPVPIHVEPGSVRASAWRWKRSVVAIFANESSEAVNATVRLAGVTGRAARPRLLFKERLSDLELVPLSFTRETSGTVVGSISLDAHGVQVIVFGRSSAPGSVDRFPLSEFTAGSPAIRALERYGKGWTRLKNVSEEAQTVRLERRGRTPEIYELDLAFRPVRRVTGTQTARGTVFEAKPQTAYEIGRRPRELDPFSHAATFRRLGLGISFRAGYPAEGGFSVPAQRFRAFVGAKLRIVAAWSSPKPVEPGEVKIEVLDGAWKPRRLASDEIDSAMPAHAGQVERSRRRKAIPGRLGSLGAPEDRPDYPSHIADPRLAAGLPRSGGGSEGGRLWGRELSFEVVVPEPPRRDRDLVLDLRISRGKHSVIRRMRFRVEDPLDACFDWDRGEDGLVTGTGTAELASRFEGYPFGLVALNPRKVPEGWSVAIDDRGSPMRQRVEVKAPPEKMKDGAVHALGLQAKVEGTPPIELDLPRLLCSGGKLYTATRSPRRIKVPQITGGIELDGKLGEEEWSEAAQLAGFLGIGVANYADRQPVAWVCRDADSLYLAARLPIRGVPRARRSEHDRVEMSDDLFELYLDTDSAPGHHCILVNPNGQTSDFAVRPGPDGGKRAELSWESKAAVKARVGKDSWALELRLPHASLPGTEFPPAAGWRFNIRTPHGIAPRFAEVYSFSSRWYPEPAEFALMEL